PRSRKASPRRADSPFEGGICRTGGNRCHARPCATGGRSLRDSALPGASGLWRAPPVDQRRKLMRSPLVAPLGVLFLLAACSGTAETEDEPAQAETTTETAKDDSKLPDTGGDAPIELTAIEKGELLRLDGDHECRFIIKGQPGPALVAKA